MPPGRACVPTDTARAAAGGLRRPRNNVPGRCLMPVGGRFDAVGLIGGERGVLRGAAREYVVEVRGEPSCSIGCPAGVNVKAYVNLIASGRFEEAVDIIREANPFPAVCGRVCTRPCEAGCEQGRSSDPVAIRALKRHAADVEMSRRTGPPAPCEVGHDERVAIVGAG
ncbi:MAG TPA: hypothetical protein EYP43_03620, partial [Thermoplasmata archaeon]|nr:hypothetical protein [Thermoplasmata archaeon]